MVYVQPVYQVFTGIMISVTQNVQMDNMVIYLIILAKFVILSVHNVLGRQFQIVMRVLMELILIVELVKTVMHLVLNAQAPYNQNAKDVVINFILQILLVHLVLVLVRSVQMKRFVILVQLDSFIIIKNAKRHVLIKHLNTVINYVMIANMIAAINVQAITNKQ